MSPVMLNDEIAMNINFNLLDYLISKAFLIDNAYNKDKSTGEILLENEIIYLLSGSSIDMPPVETAAALLIKKLNNKDLQKFGAELLGKNNINFFLKHHKENTISISSIDTDLYEEGDPFYINVSFFSKEKDKYDIKISEDNIYFLGFDKFINLNNFFASAYLKQGILALEGF